jgi:hypothetical protein
MCKIHLLRSTEERHREMSRVTFTLLHAYPTGSVRGIGMMDTERFQLRQRFLTSRNSHIDSARMAGYHLCPSVMEDV